MVNQCKALSSNLVNSKMTTTQWLFQKSKAAQFSYLARKRLLLIGITSQGMTKLRGILRTQFYQLSLIQIFMIKLPLPQELCMKQIDLNAFCLRGHQVAVKQLLPKLYLNKFLFLQFTCRQKLLCRSTMVRLNKNLQRFSKHQLRWAQSFYSSMKSILQPHPESLVYMRQQEESSPPF